MSSVVLIGAAVVGGVFGWLWTWRDARVSEEPLPRSEWAGNVLIGALTAGVAVYATPFVLGAVSTLEWNDRVVALRTQDELQDFLAGAGNEPALVSFFSESCLPCRAMAPSINDLASEGVRVATVRLERAPKLAMDYGVQVVPTLLVFRHSELVTSSSGYRSSAGVRGLLDRDAS